MSTVKNLKVNKKTNNFNKKLKVIVTTTAIILAGTLTFLLPRQSVEAKENEQRNTIIEHYGIDSQEFEAFEYLKISKMLNDLELDNYVADNSLYEKRNISNKLKSPNELYSLIDRFINNREYIKNNKDDLDILDDFIDSVLELKQQEILVNGYIYSTGYDVAHTNVKEATKDYAAEVFGIEDSNDIEFRYDPNNSTGEVRIGMSVETNDDTKSYLFRESFPNAKEKNIRTGVTSMVDTNTEYDKNFSDNYSYNEDRNEYILDALTTSIKLETEVAEKNLYDKDLAGKLR